MVLSEINIDEYLKSRGFDELESSSLFSKYYNKEGCFLEYMQSHNNYYIFEINGNEVYLYSTEALDEALDLYAS